MNEEQNRKMRVALLSWVFHCEDPEFELLSEYLGRDYVDYLVNYLGLIP